jgi:hypothetical protein
VLDDLRRGGAARTLAIAPRVDCACVRGPRDAGPATARCRYAHHVLLPDVGGRGQDRLTAAATAVIDVDGRAGQLAALYLAAAGVGALVAARRRSRPCPGAVPARGRAADDHRRARSRRAVRRAQP